MIMLKKKTRYLEEFELRVFNLQSIILPTLRLNCPNNAIKLNSSGPGTILIAGIFILIVLFVVLPILFRSCATLQRHMVFLPWGESS